jgi:predicted permease
VLVVAEVALAVLVASGAALLARSVTNLYALDPGVHTEGVSVVDVTMPPDAGLARGRQILAELTAGLAELPGVRSAGAAQVMPLRGGGYNLPISIEGKPDLQGQTTEFRVVTPGYLESMGITLLSGRTITEADNSDTETVVVVNEALVQEYFAGVDPIGQRVGDGINGRLARVVGVIANAAERRLTDDAVPVRYVALAQMAWVDPRWSLVLQAASGTDPVGLLDDARRTVEAVAPGVAVRATTTMSRVLDTAVGPVRQVMSLLSLLTGLALTLGAVGIYGVIAHFAARRRRDLAIRVALGLSGSRAVTRVVGHGALLVATGIGLGLIAAAGLAGLLSSFLYGVRAIDPLAFATAGTALLAVGLVAAFVPALRAGITDPMIVLREQ